MENTPTESDMGNDSSAFSSFATAGASQSVTTSPVPVALTKSTSRLRPSSRGRDVSSTILQRHAMDPFSTVGQLAFAPATQTTVVTTTTTTTTSFPPLVLQAPRHLHNRDPKLYPLAASPTPEALRLLSFSIGGTTASFREADDPELALQQCTEQYRSLEAGKGTVQSVKQMEEQYGTPSRSSRNGSSGQKYAEIPSYGGSRKKRTVSPSAVPSLAEAAELASLQRKTKKPRASLHGFTGKVGSSRLVHDSRLDKDGPSPTTPDTDAGSSGEFRVPRTRPRSRRSQLKSTSNQSKNDEGFEDSQASMNEPNRSWLLSESLDEESGTSRTSFDTTMQPPSGRFSGFMPSVLDGPGVSATPPIAETDLEPVGPFQPPESGILRPARPPPLDTLSTQDASLPSPSLSPITAAANHALHGHLSGNSSTLMDHDDENDVSSLDISEESIAENVLRQKRAGGKLLELPSFDPNSINTQLPTPSLMDIPLMISSFDAMPDEMKTYIMFQFLRRCPKSTLHFVADTVNPALKCDFLGLLPLELSFNIVKYLDVKSMCRASQVSKKWRNIINQDEKAWKDLLQRDGYTLPEGELERAVKEGWGWQYPHSADSYERDLSDPTARSDGSNSSSHGSSPGPSGSTESEVVAAVTPSGRPKRKAAGKYSGQKKRRKISPMSSKAPASSQSPWMRSLEEAQGPIAFANAAALAVHEPNVGLPSLRSLHLFKSLYQRHHLISKSWMMEDTQPHHLTFRAHGRHVVTCLQFDTDKILTGSDDTHINVYDTKTGALRARLHGHEGGVWALQYEGNILVSGSTDRSVRVWDIENAKCLQIFQGHTSTVRCLQILKPTKVGENADGSPIMMPKEPLIITGSRDSTLRIWKLPQLGDKQIHQVAQQSQDHENPYFIRALTGHHHSVRAIAAHADTLVSGSYDCSVRVWKISTGDVVHRLQGHTQKVYSVVLDHERNRCISGSMDNLVKVWSLESGQCLFNLEGHSSLVGLLDLSHDRLVSAAADSTLRIWDPENGQCKATLSAHTGAITCFQHDGQKVISGSDRTLKMWNVKTGECTKDLLTDLSGVWQVKFNERRCVAAVQRNNMTYIEVLDFGASRDGIPADQRGRRIVVDSKGREIEDLEDSVEPEPVHG